MLPEEQLQRACHALLEARLALQQPLEEADPAVFELGRAVTKSLLEAERLLAKAQQQALRPARGRRKGS